MPDMVLSFAADKVERIKDGFAVRFEIPNDSEGAPSLTKTENVKKQLIEFIRQTVLLSERQVAAETAHAGIEPDPDIAT